MHIKTSDFFKSAAHPKGYPTDGLPEVAFAGKSNVGKSSLLNTILSRKRLAKTSSTPGRTQLVNFFSLGEDIRLVDLRDYGYSRVSDKRRQHWGSLL